MGTNTTNILVIKIDLILNVCYKLKWEKTCLVPSRLATEFITSYDPTIFLRPKLAIMASILSWHLKFSIKYKCCYGWRKMGFVTQKNLISYSSMTQALSYFLLSLLWLWLHVSGLTIGWINQNEIISFLNLVNQGCQPKVIDLGYCYQLIWHYIL